MSVTYQSTYPINATRLDQIKRHTKESQKHTYVILLVPRSSTLAARILEEEGVLGEVTITPYNLQFIPIADDVISLEADNAFKELWVVSVTWFSAIFLDGHPG